MRQTTRLKTAKPPPVLPSTLVQKNKDGDVNHIVGTAKYITERKRMEDKLQESEEKLRLMFESVSEGIGVTNLNGILTEVNQKILEIHGVGSKDKILGKSFLELVAPHDRERLVADVSGTFNEESLRSFECTLIKADGTEFPGEVSAGVLKDASGNRVGFIGIGRDITERKRAEEQLAHIARLASIGELTSGIAHELNNPLTGVIGYSELLLDADIPEQIKKDVAIIHNNAQRAATIVRNLLTFARQQKSQKQLCNVNDLIKHVLEMRRYELQVTNIEVITEFDDKLLNVMADPQQLEQVFLNIILNAEQTMLEAHGRGSLTIKTKAKSDIVTISFTDDGPGIPQENLSRVFDTFFTTKEPGKGTGLGLSICHGIITEHGGRIYAESKIAEGATFFIELPVW